jgi:hypothetical protein
VLDQGIWKIRTNQELRELHKDLDRVANIKRKRLEWIGHVVRMDQGRTVKKIFESKPEGSRRKGRSIMKWLEDVEKDLREKKVKRWRLKAVDRKNGRP